MMGLAPSEFDDMALAEFDAAEQGFMRRREDDYRTAMNIQRWASFVALSGLVDLKGQGPAEVLPLPWDEKPRAQRRRTSRKELEQMRSDALETVKKFESWQKRK